jgi:hypothetical protein
MALPKAHGGLGFRDLHAFNLAMIAKQGWNMLTKPQTLVARIYKARCTFQLPLFSMQKLAIIRVMLGGVFGKLGLSLLMVVGGGLEMELA